MKMEPIVSSETSAIRTQTPGNYPKRNKLHLEHGERLKTSLQTVYTYLDLRHFLAIRLSPGAALHSESNHEVHTEGPNNCFS